MFVHGSHTGSRRRSNCLATGLVEWFGIDEMRSARDTQWSGRIEFGVRIGGRAGDVEVS